VKISQKVLGGLLFLTHTVCIPGYCLKMFSFEFININMLKLFSVFFYLKTLGKNEIYSFIYYV